MGIEALGDGALRLRLPEDVDAARLLGRLRAWPGVSDAVVAEGYAGVWFDPARPPGDLVALAALPDACRRSEQASVTRCVVIEIRYDGEDLQDIAGSLEMPVQEVVGLHAAGDYQVRMIGFLPGFAYLTGLDPRLRLPRRATPRPRVPPGALAIAGGYTGIYPFASAGGWHLVGTAVDFSPFRADTGAALRLGDRVRFEPV